MNYDFALFFSYFLIYLIQFLTLTFFLFLKIISDTIPFGIPNDNYQTKIYHLELYHYVYLRFFKFSFKHHEYFYDTKCQFRITHSFPILEAYWKQNRTNKLL